VLILDEPTSALPAHEVEQLLQWMKNLVISGSAVLFITHRVKEVFDAANVVSVLRDGFVVSTRSTSDVTDDDLFQMMMGQRAAPALEHSRTALARRTEKESKIPSDVVSNALELHNFAGGKIYDVTLNAKVGEVVGVTGLAGMGQDDLFYLIIGDKPRAGGEMKLFGKSRALNPVSAVKEGVVLVPADRLGEGVWDEGKIRENLTISILKRFVARYWLKLRHEKRAAGDAIVEHTIVPRLPEYKVKSLSGGNQQKVSLARALSVGANLLLVHEGVQGVDVGSRRAIGNLIRRVAESGVTVISVSSDYEFLAETCDRVVILAHGRTVCTLEDTEIDEDAIERACITAAK